MIAFVRKTFLTVEIRTKNPLVKSSAQGLLYLLFFSSVGLLLLVLALSGYSAFSGEDLSGFLIPLAFALAAVGLLYGLLRQGYYYTAARGLVLQGIILTYFQMSAIGIDDYSILATAMFPVIAAAGLLNLRHAVLTTVLVMMAAFQIYLTSGLPEEMLPILLTDGIILVALLAMMGTFVRYIQAPAQEFAEELQGFQRASTLAILPTPMTDEQQVYAHVLRLLVNDLGHTVAQVYRLDDSGSIQQRIGVGFYLGGLDVQDEVEISRSSGIYSAIQTKQTSVLHLSTPPRQRRHLLPGIATGIAIPLLYEDQIYGVLDVQQNAQKQLRESDITLLENIARQVSAAIGQLRQLQEMQATVEAQETTLKQQNMKLLRYEQSTLRATLDSWSSYLQQRGIDYMGFDFQDAQLSPELQMELPESMHEALTAGEMTVIAEDGGQRRVSIPILLSGHMMGAMSFQLPPGSSDLNSHQRELVEGVVQRLALALENKRLLEQTKAQVERETLANAIGGVLLSAPDVQQILQVASEQFLDAVGAVQTRINIQPEPSETMEGMS